MYPIKITRVTKILIGQQVINLCNSCGFQQGRYLENCVAHNSQLLNLNLIRMYLENIKNHGLKCISGIKFQVEGDANLTVT